jgi:hypothetical protein
MQTANAIRQKLAELPAQPPGGRRRSLSREISEAFDEIVERLRAGFTTAQLAAALGISATTLQTYLSRERARRRANARAA